MVILCRCQRDGAGPAVLQPCQVCPRPHCTLAPCPSFTRPPPSGAVCACAHSSALTRHDAEKPACSTLTCHVRVYSTCPPVLQSYEQASPDSVPSIQDSAAAFLIASSDHVHRTLQRLLGTQTCDPGLEPVHQGRTCTNAHATRAALVLALTGWPCCRCPCADSPRCFCR